MDFDSKFLITLRNAMLRLPDDSHNLKSFLHDILMEILRHRESVGWPDFLYLEHGADEDGELLVEGRWIDKVFFFNPTCIVGGGRQFTRSEVKEFVDLLVKLAKSDS